MVRNTENKDNFSQKNLMAMHMSPVQWESLDAAFSHGLYAIYMQG